MTTKTSIYPNVLIEQWLPIQEVSIECQRERGANSALPATYFLHVWWARRPLTISRAAIIASLLPSWNNSEKELLKHFSSEEAYFSWFKRLIGILGDPQNARRAIDYANNRGLRLQGNPFGYPRAFSINPADDDIRLLFNILDSTWGTRDISVLDPMSGGGSIPFEALRFGFTTFSNELNPVASVVLAATLDYPARFGPSLQADIQKYSKLFAERVENKLKVYFPKRQGENIQAYIWARTVACPITGKPVPLSPNWWLQKKGSRVAVKLICEPDAIECRFEILRGKDADNSNPDKGTISRGVAVSPWTGDIIDGDYIKREAQAGRMGQQLYAVAIQNNRGRDFRLPTSDEFVSAKKAEDEMTRVLHAWIDKGLIPFQEVPFGSKTSEPIRYGMTAWYSFFAPRQLLAMGTCVDVLRTLSREMAQEISEERAKAIVTYLSLALNKALNYNSRMSVWHPVRATMANTFDRHDFGFKWSHGEFDAAHNLLPWVTQQVVKAYREIANLVDPATTPLWREILSPPLNRLQISQSSAANLSTIPSDSLALICVDPPYYDNVQYAELSDFFYVWMRCTLSDHYPNWFDSEFTDKDEEAVANPARFMAFGTKRQKLADQDYERKMAATFREMHRTLRDDGVLTVMFTHKRVEAWDRLASALIGAGFRIEASWPVHTESEHSLHQAKKNAAASTILLVCRKRLPGKDPVWWDDIKGQVQRVAREKAQEFADQGITGVDLYISTFGPALSVISQNWPVLTSEMDPKTGDSVPLRPEIALDLARAEVIGLRKEGLLMGRQVQFDLATDWYLMAWDSFEAEEFPADEARKLAITLGLDLEQDIVRNKRLVTKKQSTVALQPPQARRKRGMVDPDATSFPSQVDAVHTVMLIYEEDGPQACQQFLRRNSLLNDTTFKACVQAMVSAIPRTRIKDKFVRPEAETLERLRLAFFEDLVVPPEEAPPELIEQLGLLDESVLGEEDEGEEEDDEE